MFSFLIIETEHIHLALKDSPDTLFDESAEHYQINTPVYDSSTTFVTHKFFANSPLEGKHLFLYFYDKTNQATSYNVRPALTSIYGIELNKIGSIFFKSFK